VRTVSKLLGLALLCALLVAQASRAADQQRVFLPVVVTPPLRIAFESWHGPGQTLRQIYTANSDGSGLKLLATSESYSDYDPQWSPRGDRIAFLSTREISAQLYLMRPDGSDQTRLTTVPEAVLHARWSPDGTKLAFVTYPSGKLSLINADGSGLRELVAGRVIELSWSPDGAELAYSTLADKTWHSDLRVIDVVRGKPFDNPVYTATAPIEQIAWHPDGTQIAFSGGLPLEKRSAIIVLRSGSLIPTQLLGGSDVTGVAWSPDGSQLAVSTSAGLHLFNRDGGGQRRLFTALTENLRLSAPDWSPDGSRIILHEYGTVMSGQSPPFRGLRVVSMDGTTSGLFSELVPGRVSWSR
jgi:Tol biopolymer transport system component